MPYALNQNLRGAISEMPTLHMVWNGTGTFTLGARKQSRLMQLMASFINNETGEEKCFYSVFSLIQGNFYWGIANHRSVKYEQKHNV